MSIYKYLNVEDLNSVKTENASIIEEEAEKIINNAPYVYENGYIEFPARPITEEEFLEYVKELTEDSVDEAVDMDEGYGAKLNPVFITLIYTGTLFTQIAGRLVKGQQYWHAGIGFGPSLKRVYTFNNNKAGHTNKFKGGLSFEGIDMYREENLDGDLEVSCIFLNDKKYKALKNTLNYYIENKEKTSYDVANLFLSLFGKKTEDKIKPNLVCSQFVDTILKSVDINVANKNSNLIKPDDLRADGHEKQFKVYEGKIKDYNAGKVAMKVNKLANNIQNDYFAKAPKQPQVAASVQNMAVKKNK